MFIFGHSGYSLVAGLIIEKKYKIKINYPLFLFSAFLPDILDKPLALFFFHNYGRTIFHNFFLHILILTAGYFFNRKYFIYFTIFSMHLILDIIPMTTWQSIFYPVLPLVKSPHEYSFFNFSKVVFEIIKFNISNVWPLTHEIIGLILIGFFIKYKKIDANN